MVYSVTCKFYGPLSDLYILWSTQLSVHNMFHSVTCKFNGLLGDLYMFASRKTVKKEKQAQRRAAMDRRMHCIIPNESYNINHNITIKKVML